MIIDMPNTRTREIAHKIEQLHEERGESATGRVLTLLIATEDADLEHALEIANSASREHPCRVIAVVPDTNPADQSGEGEPNAAEVAAEVSASRDNPAVDLTDGPNDPNDSNLNAQVRFGADAGAGEIIILRPRGGLINHPDTLVIPLLVPDAPVVAWWPTTPPSNPAKDLMGAMARSRITDAFAPQLDTGRYRLVLDTTDRLARNARLDARSAAAPAHHRREGDRQGRLPAYGNAVRMAASETWRTSRN